MKDELVDALHQPEYTGENRCAACTVVNVVIAGVLGALVARKSKLAGAITLGISLVLIQLRGYLVPGTPTLTKRYLPVRVLALFGKEPEEPELYSGLGAADAPGAEASSAGGSKGAPTRSTDGADRAVDDESADDDGETDDAAPDTEDDGVTPGEYFLEYDIVEPCEDVDDLCLTEAFEGAWLEEIERIDAESVDAEDVVSVFGVDDLVETEDDGADGADAVEEHGFEMRTYDDARLLKRGDGATVGKWPSQAALVADVTATRVLAERDPEWDTYPPRTKGELLNSLRLFLETCPTSGGAVVMDEETRESCCLSYDVVAVVCEDTGERLFEHRIDGIEA